MRERRKYSSGYETGRVYESAQNFISNHDTDVRSLLKYIDELRVQVAELVDVAPLSILQAEQVANIAAYLRDLSHAHPRLMAWCVRSTYNPEGTFHPGGTVVWSAHYTKSEAMRWLPFWQKKFERRIERGDIFEVVWDETDVLHLYYSTYDPARKGRYWNE